MADALVMRAVKRLGAVTVRADLDVDLEEAPVTVLFGPSGAGKTTLLRMAAGLARPDAGTIRFGDETWFDGARGRSLPPWRRRVGLSFQEYALFPHLTVAGNLAYGLGHLDRRARRDRVRAVAARFQVEDLLDRRPARLSGGQRQRVALARALAPEPRLLLLDEPLSALDAPTREALRRELRGRLVESRVPAVVVTHDRTEAMVLGDRVAVMIDGRIRQVGPVTEVFGRPADVEVARVMGTENVLPGRLVKRSEGLAEVDCDGLRLVALCEGDPGASVYACVRAEEVILEGLPGAETSARNLLPGTVVERLPEGPMERVVLDVGRPLVALVTRASADRLGLAPGARVAALVKAPAVRVVPR